MSTDFEFAVKSACLRRGINLRQLAEKLGYHRNSVNLAVNQGLCPGVIAAIKAELNLR